MDLQAVFDNLVDVTEPIYQHIDKFKASMTIFNTSGIEAFVTENSPTYAHKIIKQLKAFKNSQGLGDLYNPYKATYGSMPSHASCNSEIKQLYINGYFCYVYKFGMITNGLGIVRDIAFYSKNFLTSHPDIITDKKSDSPDEDKSLHDAKTVIPALKDFFEKHPTIRPNIFIDGAAFDATNIYKNLPTDLKFDKAYIPLNHRSSLTNPDHVLNESRIPFCPNDPTLPMKDESNTSHLIHGIKTFKFVCPKMKWTKCDDGKYRRWHSCDNPVLHRLTEE